MITTDADGREENATLRSRLAEAEEMLRAIRHGEIDALVVEGGGSQQVYTLHSAEEPYRNLVEQMQEGAVVLTAGGDILYSNASFAACVGEPLESVVYWHRPVREPVRPTISSRFRAGSGRRRSRLVGAVPARST
jgi:PAS domain-containing protein